MSEPLSIELFHPVIRRWFGERYGEPTDVQRRVWPQIAAGRHVLATAPTGSGKTLAAFLWSLDRLFTGAWQGGRVRVLYVSPLKALNNDIERNLLSPLGELTGRFQQAGVAVPEIRVATRSGDTLPKERQRMVRRPPEILITTPESLNILLSSDGGRAMLQGLEAVLLDEIHAVAGSKRGTHLITAVERLTLLSGEFQRIALSATIRPLERIARFVGGYELRRRGSEASYHPRPVEILEAAGRKEYAVRVDFTGVTAMETVEELVAQPILGALLGPERVKRGVPTPATDAERMWKDLIAALRKRIDRNRSTLVFTNSRRMAEKITRLLNEDAGGDLAYSHHGSLSREIRTVVEQRFKQGRLAAIVATNSLELGIDIGDLDEVLMVKAPPSASSAVQRVGRAGHAVGAVSAGTFYPLFSRDLLDAAVLSRAVVEQAIEPVEPIGGALDVLAQVILSMTSAREWDVDGLYDQLRASDPYHELPRRHFDLVLDMLAGRYADSRIRELTPRLARDRIHDTVKARRSARRLLYLSGGTIPDRGYFHLRLQRNMAKIGELDEEFVWERSVGDRFLLGTQTWRITKVTHNDVLVEPSARAGGTPPFWRGEEIDRSFFLSERVGSFLEWASELLNKPNGGAEQLATALRERYPLEPNAVEVLVRLLESQRAATGKELPHRHHLVVEHVRDPQNPATHPILLHTHWGGRVNRAFGIALAAAGEKHFGAVVDVVHDDNCLLVNLAEEIEGHELLALVDPARLEELLRVRLEDTGFFGARFRENAGRAMLLPRGDFKRRVPLWLNRQRSKKLLAATRKYRDFPLVLETWRTCLQDELDLASLQQVLGELERGEIRVTEVKTSGVSPFAANLSWRLTNRFMYENDVPEGRGGPGLRADLISELVHSSQLRPRVPDELVDRLQRKLQRVFPGYAPRPDVELVEWVKERLVIPLAEWHELLDAVARDHGLDEAELDAALEPAAERFVTVRRGGAVGDEERSFVAATELLPKILGALEGTTFFDAEVSVRLATKPEVELPAGLLTRLEPTGGERRWLLADLVGEWLQLYGPVPSDFPPEVFGLTAETMPPVLDELRDEQRIVIDQIREGATGGEICDVENLERLLRMARAERRPTLTALPLAQLPLFLAAHQGVAPRRDGVEGLQAALEGLFAYPAAAEVWEEELLPARLDPYQPAWLDSLMQESELLWVGCGTQRLTFAFASDLDLLPAVDDETAIAEEADQEGGTPAEKDGAVAADLFPDGGGRHMVHELAERSGLAPAIVADRLWDLGWQGRVTNDTFAAVRRGVMNRFKATSPEPSESSRSGRRRSRGTGSRWRVGRQRVGHWYPLPTGSEQDADAIDREEVNRERVRVLLQRYGVLFRELLARELRPLQWGRLFRTLRIMELSGEVLAGHFFEGIHGLQFASPSAYRRLRDGLPEDVVFWISAVDPASPCGLGLEGLRGEVPKRLSSNHLVFHGARLVLVSEARGKRLDIRVDPDHPRLLDYLEPLSLQLTRSFQPRRSIEVEAINGEPARSSPYAAALGRRFQTSSGTRSLLLHRKF